MNVFIGASLLYEISVDIYWTPARELADLEVGATRQDSNERGTCMQVPAISTVQIGQKV